MGCAIWQRIAALVEAARAAPVFPARALYARVVLPQYLPPIWVYRKTKKQRSSALKARDLTRRQATRIIEGVSFPVFLSSGRISLIDMTVFEDGLIEAPDLMDLSMFEAKLRRNNLRTSLPEDAFLKMGSWGGLELRDAQWTMTADDLLERVYGLLTELNPGLDNLVDLQGSSTHVVDGRSEWKQNREASSPWQFSDAPDGRERDMGRAYWGFERHETAADLVQLILFENDAVSVVGSAGTRQIAFEAFEHEVNGGRFNFPAEGDRVTIRGLGEATCAFAAPGVCAGERLIQEFRECRRIFRGEPTSFAICRAAANAYWAHPTLANLDTLRRSYEEVPGHLRQYCGDMDEKDIPIRIALYGAHEIENWMHWQAARAMGLPLPMIEVPTPLDG